MGGDRSGQGRHPFHPEVDQHEVAASVTGKPPSLGGTRPHAGATAAGVIVHVGPPSQSWRCPWRGRAVIQGFGNVGGPLAFLLSSAGMRVIAVSDVGGAVHNPGGLDIGTLADHVAKAIAARGLFP